MLSISIFQEVSSLQEGSGGASDLSMLSSCHRAQYALAQGGTLVEFSGKNLYITSQQRTNSPLYFDIITYGTK